MQKRCPVCNDLIAIELFRRNKSRKDGREGICRHCKVIKEITWREANRDRKRAQQRKHYADNRDTYLRKRRDNYDYIKARARSMAKRIPLKKCMFCDKVGERHHEDYSQPMVVVFLCKSHHKQVHDGSLQLLA